MAGTPSGFIMSAHFRCLLHVIASKQECICLQQCLVYLAISHCISDRSPSESAHPISALSHRYTQKGSMQFRGKKIKENSGFCHLKPALKTHETKALGRCR